MKIITFFASVAFMSVAALAQDVVPGRIIRDAYIVVLKPGASPAVVAARNGAVAKHTYDKVVNGFSVDLPSPALAAMLKDADVDMIIADREVAAYARASGGGGSTSTQVVPEGIKRIGAQNLSYTGAGVGVAVVDSGIDLVNTDLNIGSKSYSSVSTSANDDNGHGTHCAGIIGARNNNVAVVGVAPAATVYAVKVLDRRGSGSDSTVIAGLNWIANNANSASPAIKVVSMSLGRPGSVDDNPAYRTAIQSLVNAGITVVAAAGNDCSMVASQQVPASYPEVITVASTTAKNGLSAYPGFSGIPGDTASYFTTDGAVAISAPGADQEDVSSTGTITSIGILSLKKGGGTTRMSGTSMACPHVAGVAALLYQKFGSLNTPADTRTRITSSASNISVAPYASPTSCYTFDGVREGVLSASGALSAP